eukprot:2240118-Pleurochrysis_carterae.AAC.1
MQVHTRLAVECTYAGMCSYSQERTGPYALRRNTSLRSYSWRDIAGRVHAQLTYSDITRFHLEADPHVCEDGPWLVVAGARRQAQPAR